jgi:hypothetical protein
MKNEQPLTRGPGLEALTQELAELIAELKRRAQQARSDRAHMRYVGALIPLYGLLIRALVVSRAGAEARGAVAEELQALLHEMQGSTSAAAGTSEVGARV